MNSLMVVMTIAFPIKMCWANLTLANISLPMVVANRVSSFTEMAKRPGSLLYSLRRQYVPTSAWNWEKLERNLIQFPSKENHFEGQLEK